MHFNSYFYTKKMQNIYNLINSLFSYYWIWNFCVINFECRCFIIFAKLKFFEILRIKIYGVSAHTFPTWAGRNGLREFHFALFLLVTFLCIPGTHRRHHRASYAPLSKRARRCMQSKIYSLAEHTINKSARIPHPHSLLRVHLANMTRDVAKLENAQQ